MYQGKKFSCSGLRIPSRASWLCLLPSPCEWYSLHPYLNVIITQLRNWERTEKNYLISLAYSQPKKTLIRIMNCFTTVQGYITIHFSIGTPACLGSKAKSFLRPSNTQLCWAHWKCSRSPHVSMSNHKPKHKSQLAIHCVRDLPKIQLNKLQLYLELILSSIKIMAFSVTTVAHQS